MSCAPTERRGHPRRIAPYVAQLQGREPRPIWDISQIGAFVCGPQDLPIGAVCALRLELGSPRRPQPVWVRAEVVHLRPCGAPGARPQGMGVRFCEPVAELGASFKMEGSGP